MTAASAGDAATAGRGAGTAVTVDGGRATDGAGPVAGSGVMMFTGGVEAADGNSALVGLPVGIDDGSAATTPAPACAGAFHDAA